MVIFIYYDFFFFLRKIKFDMLLTKLLSIIHCRCRREQGRHILVLYTFVLYPITIPEMKMIIYWSESNS